MSKVFTRYAIQLFSQKELCSMLFRSPMEARRQLSLVSSILGERGMVVKVLVEICDGEY